MAPFIQNTSFSKFWNKTTVLKKNADFFRRKLAIMAENCDHLAILTQVTAMLLGRKIWRWRKCTKIATIVIITLTPWRTQFWIVDYLNFSIWGRCYDHNFLRFSANFGKFRQISANFVEKNDVFLKNQCFDQLFA
jgi:hypothetical protein